MMPTSVGPSSLSAGADDSTILVSNIGDQTPHGRANHEVVKGLVRWMEDHADEISGLAVEKPRLPQLRQLNAEHLKAAVRGMDPWAGE